MRRAPDASATSILARMFGDRRRALAVRAPPRGCTSAHARSRYAWTSAAAPAWEAASAAPSASRGARRPGPRARTASPRDRRPFRSMCAREERARDGAVLEARDSSRDRWRRSRERRRTSCDMRYGKSDRGVARVHARRAMAPSRLCATRTCRRAASASASWKQISPYSGSCGTFSSALAIGDRARAVRVRARSRWRPRRSADRRGRARRAAKWRRSPRCARRDRASRR